MRKFLGMLSLGLCALTPAIPALAQGSSTTYVYIFHGAFGRDISSHNFPSLPVDIEIDGTCLIKGANTTDFDGVFEFSSGAHTVSVMPADTLSPCTQTALVSSSVTFKAGFNQILTIGEDKSDMLTLYLTDLALAPTASGAGRISVNNVSDVPNLTFTLTPQVSGQGTTLTYSPVRRGTSQAQNANAINYVTQLSAFPTTTLNYGFPIVVRPQANSVVMIFAFGSVKSGSLRMITKIIGGVF